MKIIALIPARGGSKRVPGKNMRPLGKHPLLFYTIAAAQQSGIFDMVFVSSEDTRILYLAECKGAFPVARSTEFATDTSPDIEWVDEFFGRNDLYPADAFAILRPTSPFRTAETIRRAWAEFQEKQPCDSIRAVSRGPNPWKMWFYHPCGELIELFEGRPLNLMRWKNFNVPKHSMPSQMMPECYIQNASLEIAWTRNVTERGSISGDVIKPFFTQGYEGFDINTEDDFILAEALIERGLVTLPEVR